MATIADNLQTIIDIKADIKTAIENKGVTVGDASFSEYAGKIDNIEGSGSPSVDVGALGLKFANSTFTEVPSVFDFSNVTDLSYMFSTCSNLTSVPKINTSNITDMSAMFPYCYRLTSIPEFNASNVKYNGIGSTFKSCESLTDVGGFTNLGMAFSGPSSVYVQFDDCPLTHLSALNIINNVYNLNNNLNYYGIAKISFSGVTLSEDDIAIATNKAWTIGVN